MIGSVYENSWLTGIYHMISNIVITFSTLINHTNQMSVYLCSHIQKGRESGDVPTEKMLNIFCRLVGVKAAPVKNCFVKNPFTWAAIYLNW